MKKLLILLFLALPALPAFAANHYVLQGASGSGNGSDWTNACPDFTGSCAVSALVRGDTYYVGTGTYAGRTWNKAASGTSVITIKKAIIADHGTATGWNNSFAAQATFTNRNDIETDYWTFDGQVGDYASGIGTYGFKDQYSVGNFANCGGSNGGVTGAGFLLCGNNITIKYFDCSGYTGTGDYNYPDQAKCIEAYGGDSWTVSHVAMHGCESCLQGGGDNFILEYSYIYNSRSIASAFHNNIFFISATTGGTIRYNNVWDYNAEGFFVTGNDGPVSNLAIYGNSMWNDGTQSDFPRGIELRQSFSYSGILLYNNSFLAQNGAILDQTGTTGNTCSSCQAFNNLAVNSGITLGAGFTSGNNTANSTTSVFTTITPLYSVNLHLTTSVGPGTTLSSPYNVDPDGNVRGATGVWDRGTYEFLTASVPTVTTTSASSITSTTATSGGNVTADGGSTVTSRGVCYATTSTPTTPCTSNGTGTGSYTASLTGLIPATLYHVRAYATNSTGTAYGSDLTFTTVGPMSSLYMQREANGVDDGYPMPLIIGAEWDDYIAAVVYENNPLATWSNPSGSYVTFTLASGTSTIQAGDGIFIRNFTGQPDTLCQVAASPAPTSTSFSLDTFSCNGGNLWTSTGSGSASGAYYWKKEGAGMNPNVTWSIIDHGSSTGAYMLRNLDKTVVAGGTPCANPDLHTSTCYTQNPVLTNTSPIEVYIEISPNLTPTCTMTGTMQAGTLVLGSNYKFTLRATSIQDPSIHADREYIVCEPGAGSGHKGITHFMGGYEQSFKNEIHPEYTQNFADYDQYVKISMVSDDGLGDATITTFAAPVGDGFLHNGGVLPEFLFNSGTVTDGYLITACPDSDPTGVCAKKRIWVSNQAKPAGNPDKVIQAPCDIDPIMTAAGGTTYEVGPGQTWPDFVSTPNKAFTWGSIFRFHGETGSSGAPITLANYMEFGYPTNYASFTTNQDVPSWYFCGIPAPSGDLPVLEASNATANSNITSFTALGNMVTVNGISPSIPVPDPYNGNSNIWHQWGIAGIRIQNNTPGFNYYPPGMTSGPQNQWGLGSAIRTFADYNFTVKGFHSINNANGMLSDCAAQSGWVRNCSANGRMYGSHGEGYGVDPNSTEHFIYLQDFHDLADYNLEDGSNSTAATSGFSMRGFRSLYIGNRIYCLTGTYHCPNGPGGDSENQDADHYYDINRAFGPTPNWAGGTSCSDGSTDYPFCSDPAHPGMAFGGLATFAAFATEHFPSFFYGWNAFHGLNTNSGDGCNVSISQNHGNNGLEMQHKIYGYYNLNDCPRAEAYGGAGQFEDVRPTSGVFGDSVQPVSWPSAGAWINNVYWWNDNTGGGGFYSSFGRGTAHGIFKTNMLHVGQFSPGNINIPLFYGGYAFNASQSGISQASSVDQFSSMNPVEAKFGATWTGANFITSVLKPYDVATLKPITGSGLIGAATVALPYPVLLYPPLCNANDGTGTKNGCDRRLHPDDIGPYDHSGIAPPTALGVTFGVGRSFGAGVSK